MTEVETLSRVRRLARTGAARAIRLSAGVSIREVARAASVAPSTVFRWESGERTPRGDGALRYADVLDGLARQ